MNLRLPNITGASEREILTQMRSYLYQLVGDLQFALQNVNTSEAVTPVPKSQLPSVGVSPRAVGEDPRSTFESIKALIIKSADIAEAYYEEINKRLEGIYVAQSDFGDYAQKTSQEIEETSTSTTRRFENLQVIITGYGNDIKSIDGTLKTIGEDVSYQQQAIVTINNGIEELGGNLASVEGEVIALDSSLQTAKTELQSSVANTKTELSGSINSTKSQLENNINSTKEELSGSIDSAKTELSGSINNAKTELEGDLNNAKKELSNNINNTKAELSSSIDTAKSELSGDIDNAKSELTEAVNNVDEDLQGAKTDINGRIDDTNGSVAGLGAGLNDANSRIAEVDEDLQDSKEAINNSIQGVQERVTGVNALLEDAKAQLQGSLDDLQIYVTGLQDVIIGVTAYLKSGLLYYTDAGVPVYGLEIGQSVKDGVSGEEVFNKYARFTSEKLSFYDSNGIEVAYISDKKLYIKMAQITVSFQIGGLIDLVMANGDVVTKWVGG